MDFDFPRSWTDKPFFPVKPLCPNNTMSCPFKTGHFLDVDYETYLEATRRISNFLNHKPRNFDNFFLAVGFQSPRLPWSYPEDVAKYKYPDPMKIPISRYLSATSKSNLEWFRPTEIDMYSNIRNVTHDEVMKKSLQHILRRDYFAAVTHVDDMVGKLLQFLADNDLIENTNIIFMADHGQNLGEYNMWSMMNLMETSLQVPLIIRPAISNKHQYLDLQKRYQYPIELVDVFPTAVSMAGLPKPPFRIPGVDFSQAIYRARNDNNKSQNPILKRYAFSQITRCRNCTLAYSKTKQPKECLWDKDADRRFFVPCAMTPRNRFDFMGFSVRTADHLRYSVFCKWDGKSLRGVASTCKYPELYNLTGSAQTDFEPELGEFTNLALDPSYKLLAIKLFEVVKVHFAFL